LQCDIEPAYQLLSSSMTYKFSSSRAIALAVILVVSGACDTGSKSRTRADIAADSALAADLALTNRDTVLVDSIGQYRSAHSALADTGKSDSAGLNAASKPAAVSKAQAAVVRTVPAPVAPTTPTPIRPKPKPATVRVARASPSARVKVTSPIPATLRGRRTGNPCDSPITADQQTCLRTSLAAADKRLSGIYRALIVELRRKENAGSGEPASVTKLRASQREWLANRDAECRRRGRGKEGALWAYPRVHCLAQFSDQRANELSDEFSRLTAR
jgi:uncharacterized protein YecT (DUF1311 family)